MMVLDVLATFVRDAVTSVLSAKGRTRERERERETDNAA